MIVNRLLIVPFKGVIEHEPFAGGRLMAKVQCTESYFRGECIDDFESPKLDVRIRVETIDWMAVKLLVLLPLNTSVDVLLA